jgi:tetratricopeptide (TPR) repeat protein
MKKYWFIFAMMLAYSGYSGDWEQINTGNPERIVFQKISPKIIKEISSQKLTAGQFTVYVEFIDKETGKNHQALCQEYGLKQFFSSAAYSYTGRNTKNFKNAFDLVNRLEPLGTTLNQISDWFGMRISDPAMMLSLAREGKFEEATAYAIDYSTVDQDILWELGEYYYANKEFDKALSIYQDITEFNRHYIEAGKRCDCIISYLLDLNQAGDYELTAIEKREYIKSRLKFSLQQKDARLAGKLFEELFNVKLTDNVLNEFAGHYPTLIGIGEAIMARIQK